MIYGQETSTDVSGWTAKALLKSDVSAPGATNDGSSTATLCGSKSIGTDYYTFICTPVTAATSITLETSSSKAQLAEVVIGGFEWESFPCQPGTSSPSGTFSLTDGNTCKDCVAGTYQDLEGMKFCRSAQYINKTGVSDGNFATYRDAWATVFTFSDPYYLLHDITIYAMNYDDFNGDQSSVTATEAEVVTCASTLTAYEAADCVGLVDGAALKLTKDDDSVLSESIFTTPSIGKTRRSQTFTYRPSTPLTVKNIAFSQKFYIAEVYIHGVNVSPTKHYETYQDDTGETEVKICDQYMIANVGFTDCTYCPGGTEYKKSSDYLKCENCTAGSIRPEGDSNHLCTNCDSGNVAETEGLTSCRPCYKGTYSASTTKCEVCPAGEITATKQLSVCTACSQLLEYSTTNRSECATCQEGTVPNADKDGCDDCDAGKERTDTKSQTACTDCPTGYFSTSAGTDTCSKCEDGKEQNSAKTDCDPCDAGKHKDSSMDTCEECPDVEYTDETGQADCKTCAAGYQSNAAHTECDVCPSGMKRGSGDVVCASCGLGYHTSGSEGASECTACPVGHKGVLNNTSGAGIDGKDAHMCSPCAVGEFQALTGQTTCDPCSNTTVAETEGLAACVLCDLGTVRKSATECVVCEAGQYNDDQEITADKCPSCPYNTFSTEQKTETCERCPDHYYAPIGSTSCTKCPDTETLVNSTKDERWQKCISDEGAACEAINITGPYGTYNVPFKPNNKTYRHECHYDKAKGDLTKFAMFLCETDPMDKTKAYFTTSYKCYLTENSDKFEEAAKNTTAIQNDPEGATSQLVALTDTSGDHSGLADVDATSDFLKVLVPEPAAGDEDDATKEQPTLSKATTENVVAAVSNLASGNMQSVDTSQAVKVCDRMVSSLKAVAKATTVEDELVKSPNLALMKATPKESSDGSKKVAITLNLEDPNDLTSMSADSASDGEYKEPSAAIDSGASSVTVVILKDDTFFPTNVSVRIPSSENATAITDFLWDTMTFGDEGGEEEVSDNIIVNSIVLEVDMGNAPPGTTLDLFIKPNFMVGSVNASKGDLGDYRKVQIRYKCGVYKPDAGIWDTEDCQTIYDEMRADAGVMCRCTHNTSFAVLMAAEEIDPGYLESQSIMSQAFLAASILGLCATIGLIIPATSIAKTRSSKVNMCFSFTLLLASVLFLIQDFLVKPDDSGYIKLQTVPCAVYTMLQHYLWLVVFMWTLIEGFLMYLSLVLVFGSHISKYMLKFNLVAWLVPLPLPLIGYFAFTKKHVVGGVEALEHNYMADSMCFLKPGTIAFYALFFGPLVLAIVVNLVFFGLVLRVIRSSTNSSLTDRELFVRQLKAAVAVMVLLGTGWIIGIFMNIPEPHLQVTLQYIFICVNATQGVFVFVFYVVLNDGVKNYWLEKFGMKAPAAKSTSSMKKPSSNVYANSTAKTEDHTYSTAAEFPAKNENNANI